MKFEEVPYCGQSCAIAMLTAKLISFVSDLSLLAHTQKRGKTDKKTLLLIPSFQCCVYQQLYLIFSLVLLGKLKMYKFLHFVTGQLTNGHIMEIYYYYYYSSFSCLSVKIQHLKCRIFTRSAVPHTVL